MSALEKWLNWRCERNSSAFRVAAFGLVASRAGSWETKKNRKLSEAHRGRERKTVVHIVFAEAGEDGTTDRAKGVGAHVKATVVPMAKLAIVGQRAWSHRSLIDSDRVKEPATCYRIARLRDSETLVERPGTWEADKGKVRQDPTVSQLVVNHHRVAKGVGVAERPGRARRKRESSL